MPGDCSVYLRKHCLPGVGKHSCALREAADPRSSRPANRLPCMAMSGARTPDATFTVKTVDPIYCKRHCNQQRFTVQELDGSRVQVSLWLLDSPNVVHAVSVTVQTNRNNLQSSIVTRNLQLCVRLCGATSTHFAAWNLASTAGPHVLTFAAMMLPMLCLVCRLAKPRLFRE